MPLHHLMIGTWTPPGAIFTVQFDDEKLELKLIKKTDIPKDEPISWMTFDVRRGPAISPPPPFQDEPARPPPRRPTDMQRHSTPRRISTAPP